MTVQDEFKKLEAELGERLRELPGVQADSAFKDSLRNRLVAGHAGNNKPGRVKSNSILVRYVSVAAVLVVILAGWLALFNPKESGSPNIGPLFMAQAQAGGVPMPRVTLGGGLDALRQVEFKAQDTMPSGPGEGNVFRLQHDELTVDRAMDLAGRLGMENPVVVEDGSTIPENRHIYITGTNANLVTWPQGSWLYTRHQDGPAGTEGRLTAPDMEAAVLKWLEAAGLLPQEEFTVQNNPLDYGAEILLRREKTLDGAPLTGFVPEIKVTVTSDGEVIEAYGTWYADDLTFKMPLATYDEALEALERGEGVFEAPNYRHYQAGTATISDVQTAYQLAYAIDYTPYLVPVAVFTGQYRPEGGTAGEFTALVPLLKNEARPNSGNFVLKTELPAAPVALPTVVERDVEVARAELQQLADFFGIDGEPAADGTIRDAGGEISATSWDGGWLYRVNYSGQVREENRIDEARALEIATGLVRRIPVLPGTPGEPVVRDDGSGFSLVVFPLLYNGIPVTSSNPPGYVSFLSVQLGPRGDVWSVNCAHPMQTAPGGKLLLTPEQAWEQLLDNKSLVHVDGFFGSMPGDRFVAAWSGVTTAALVYIPRHPELTRNENYDPVYMFKGSARVGERQVGFTAYVDAVRQ